MWKTEKGQLYINMCDNLEKVDAFFEQYKVYSNKYKIN